MSQNNTFSSINETSSSLFDDNMDKNNKISSSNSLDTLSNDDWKSIDNNNDIDINEIQYDQQDNNNGWANFDTFTKNTSLKTVSTTAINMSDDNWADFESSTIQSIEKINKDDDIFGDYGEVQISEKSSPSINSLTTEQIESLISTCFPLESSTLSTDTDSCIPFELPSFTTYKDQIKQLPCFKHSLSLWNVLSNISNDPIGIKYQWRKSHTEHLFHQALDVHERFHIKTIPLTSKISPSDAQTMISNVNNENKLLPQTVDPNFNCKQNNLENPVTEKKIQILLNIFFFYVFDVNKTFDLDYDISPTTIHRNNSPILQQHSTPIKTIDLYPGSTTVLNDDVKSVIDSVSNFSFMNPKALMLSNTT